MQSDRHRCSLKKACLKSLAIGCKGHVLVFLKSDHTFNVDSSDLLTVYCMDPGCYRYSQPYICVYTIYYQKFIEKKNQSFIKWNNAYTAFRDAPA